MYTYFFYSSYLIQLTRLTCDSGTEAAGEQGGYYDSLFTYRESNETSYFVISENSEGGAAGVGPFGVSTLKESPMASSSKGCVTDSSATEGEMDILVMEAVMTDEVLPEVASGASPTTVRVSSMEPAGISVAAVAEAIEAVSPLGNILIICKQSFLDLIIPCFNKVLLQVFRLWVHRL